MRHARPSMYFCCFSDRWIAALRFAARPLLLAAVLLSLPACGEVRAASADLPAPSGRVILTVSGDLAVTNGDGEASFDRDMLQDVGWRQVDSYTPWTEGLQQFEGVPLQLLIDRLGAKGEKFVARALNDYKVDMPIGDARSADFLLALKQNGKWLSVREKGPIWIIYPHADGPDKIPDLHATRMIWQLRSLAVE